MILRCFYSYRIYYIGECLNILNTFYGVQNLWLHSMTQKQHDIVVSTKYEPILKRCIAILTCFLAHSQADILSSVIGQSTNPRTLRERFIRKPFDAKDCANQRLMLEGAKIICAGKCEAGRLSLAQHRYVCATFRGSIAACVRAPPFGTRSLNAAISDCVCASRVVGQGAGVAAAAVARSNEYDERVAALGERAVHTDLRLIDWTPLPTSQHKAAPATPLSRSVALAERYRERERERERASGPSKPRCDIIKRSIVVARSRPASALRAHHRHDIGLYTYIYLRARRCALGDSGT